MIKLVGCHLYGPDIAELSKFATKIGLSKSWINVDPVFHYEIICPHMFQKAEFLLRKKYKR